MSTNQKNGSDEREFLHNLATPLGTAILLVDSLLDDAKKSPKTELDDLMRISEIYNALEKINNFLKSRREILVSRGVPSARS